MDIWSSFPTIPLRVYEEQHQNGFGVDIFIHFSSTCFHPDFDTAIGLLVSALDSGSSSPGSSPGGGHCVVFLGKTLNSHCASLHPGV